MEELDLLKIRMDRMYGAQAALFCAVKSMMAAGHFDAKFPSVLDIEFNQSKANLLASVSEAHLEGFDHIAELIFAQATGTPQE